MTPITKEERKAAVNYLKLVEVLNPDAHAVLVNSLQAYDAWGQIRDDLARAQKEEQADVADVIADIDSLIWRRMNGLEAECEGYKTISFG